MITSRKFTLPHFGQLLTVIPGRVAAGEIAVLLAA